MATFDCLNSWLIGFSYRFAIKFEPSNWKIMSRGHAYINCQRNVISTFELKNNNDNHTFVSMLPYWMIWIEKVGLGL
jgi:hypothetical protein